LMSSLPWEEAPPFVFINLDCQAKDGATTTAYADMSGQRERKDPLVVWWNYGSGRSVALTPAPIGGGPNVFTEWEYWPDFIINLMAYTFDGNLGLGT
jgi:hypothetical protein